MASTHSGASSIGVPPVARRARAGWLRAAAHRAGRSGALRGAFEARGFQRYRFRLTRSLVVEGDAFSSSRWRCSPSDGPANERTLTLPCALITRCQGSVEPSGRPCMA